MRIGILASHPIQYQAPWFRGLAERGEVTVFFAHRQTPAQQARAGFGVAFDWDVDLLSGYDHVFLTNVSKHPSVESFGGSDTPEIRSIIERGKFDAFIVNGWYLKSFLQGARACRAAGLPVFIRGDSQLGMAQSRPRRMIKEITHRILLRQFDGFLYVGRRNAEYLRHYGAREDQMFFVPHFVDNEWFARKADASDRPAIRSGWGAGPESFVVLFAGKFIPKKRPLDILAALPKCVQFEHDVIAVFVGSGELEQPLREESLKLGVSARFEGFKNQTQMPDCYRAADVLVLPSDHRETWGLVVNEAMGCGLPAIVSDAVGCGPDLIVEGATGYTFPLGNTLALADRLTKLLRQKRTGHDFRPALKSKMDDYSLRAAVKGTMSAVQSASVP
jgi:glycosyltransferase involved in cell wall biosynthesis